MELALIISLFSNLLLSVLACTSIIKAYREGLKHNYELKNNIAPSEPTSVVKEVIDTRQEIKEQNLTSEMLDQYLNG